MSTSIHVLGSRVDAASYESAIRDILGWTRKQESKYVCLANVHMIMEAWDDPDFQGVVDQADLVLPDGMPLAVALRVSGLSNHGRVRGPTLMTKLIEAAAESGIPVGLYGGRPDTLALLEERLLDANAKLDLAFSVSPPFRPSTDEEQSETIEAINASGIRLLFVGLGCPKQEAWMAKHRGRVQCVMLGVGAAFDFHSGQLPEAPTFLQRAGLEWLFRLAAEPRRLWRRYLVQNTRFLALVGLEAFRKLVRS